MADRLTTTLTAAHKLTIVDRYSAFETVATVLAFEPPSGPAMRARLRRSLGELLTTPYSNQAYLNSTGSPCAWSVLRGALTSSPMELALAPQPVPVR